MALNKSPAFGSTPQVAAATITAANTNLDGATGTYTTLLTAGTDGVVVTSLTAMARATVAATALRLFVSYDAGVTKTFLAEQLMAAYPVLNTTAQTPVTFINKLNPDQAIRLPASAVLYCTIAVALAGGISFVAEYTSLTAA